jgi:hypothetical protein
VCAVLVPMVCMAVVSETIGTAVPVCVCARVVTNHMSSPLITLQGLGPLPEVMEGVADDLLRDLLMRMLEPRPASRISASGALCHPYCE